MVLKVKIALEDEHSDFACIQAVEGVWLSKPSWHGYRRYGSMWSGWWGNILGGQCLGQ